MPRYYQGRKRTTKIATDLRFGDAFLKTTTRPPRTATMDTFMPTLTPTTPVVTDTTTTVTTTGAAPPAVRQRKKQKDASDGWSIEMIA